MNRFLKTCLAALLTTMAFAVQDNDAKAQWEPTKPIQFVIMAGKGGGADKMARQFIRIIESDEMVPVPIEPVNMPENSGADALQFMEKNKGNPYVIMVTLNSFYTTPINHPELNIDVTKFTPVGRMAEDTFVLWVNASSGIKTFEQFLTEAAKKGPEWVMAGTGKNAEDQLLTDFLNTNYNLKMTYKPLKGGGAVAKELVENVVNSTVNNPAEADNYYVDGKVIPLVAFTPERLEVYFDTPTIREKGNNFYYFMQRSVVAAPGIKADAAAYYAKLFKKVYESKDWQDYMNFNSLHGTFETGNGLVDYWGKERELHRQLLATVSKTN